MIYGTTTLSNISKRIIVENIWHLFQCDLSILAATCGHKNSILLMCTIMIWPGHVYSENLLSTINIPSKCMHMYIYCIHIYTYNSTSLKDLKFNEVSRLHYFWLRQEPKESRCFVSVRLSVWDITRTLQKF